MPFTRQIFDVDDARLMARKRLPRMVFDYIDGAAGREHGTALNRTALDDIRLCPRVLRNVSTRDLSVQVFGHDAQRPFGISPMGMCNLAAPHADMMLSKMAAKYRTPLGVSTVSSTRLETMLEIAEGNAWFQLYFSGDGSNAMQLVKRAQVAGYKTLVLTADVPEVGRRPRELRHGFKVPFRIGPSQFIDFALHPRWSLHSLLAGKPEMANFTDGASHFDRTESRALADWSYLAKLRDSWQGNLVVKGVLNVEDALRMKEMGIDAIQVSSHGARQMDAAPCPILKLHQIRQAVGNDYPLFYDTGLRSGEDVVKAYAIGADYVFLGRALLFAIAGRGAKGLSEMTDVIADEISLTLAQLGRVNMQSLSDTLDTAP